MINEKMNNIIHTNIDSESGGSASSVGKNSFTSEDKLKYVFLSLCVCDFYLLIFVFCLCDGGV